MKAVVYTKYGSPDVLQLKEVEKPIPKDDEVLIKVHAASINSWDWDMLTGRPLEYRLLSGLLKPTKAKTLGCDSSNGIYVTVGGRSARILQLVFLGSLISMIGNKKLTLIMHKPNKDLNILNELFESGKVKPVVDRCFPLSETAEAFQYFGEGHFKGKVVITVEHNDT